MAKPPKTYVGIFFKNIPKTNCSYRSKEKASLQSFGKPQQCNDFSAKSMPCRGIYKKVKIFPETVASKYRDAFEISVTLFMALKSEKNCT